MKNEQQRIENYNKKIMIAVRQWDEIINKEMAYSEDLRNHEKIDHAKSMKDTVMGMLK